MLRICAAFVLIVLPFSAVAGVSGTVRVIDADTWDVAGERVRLFGIDAPEMDQTCETPQGQSWSCGVWAADQVRQRYGGHHVECERQDVDRYGRIVARCFAGDKDVAREIVLDGLAFAFRRYSMEYDLDEKSAAVNARGLHGHHVQSPAAFRAARPRATAQAQQPASGDCNIKGNISSKGERIYHLPGQRHYRQTRINATKGERWFCSESAARAAGWRRSRR